jgi:hypothetical protein
VTALHTALLVVAALWVIIGSLFNAIAIRELFDPAKEQVRVEQRRRTMDRFHADATTDYMETNEAFLRVFISVMTCWPWFVWMTVRGGDRHD